MSLMFHRRRKVSAFQSYDHQFGLTLSGVICCTLSVIGSFEATNRSILDRPPASLRPIAQRGVLLYTRAGCSGVHLDWL